MAVSDAAPQNWADEPRCDFAGRSKRLRQAVVAGLDGGSMRTPLAAWRAGSRWPLALVAVVTMIVVAIGVSEALGWPFLVSPVEQWLARTLDRRVVFSGGTAGESGVRIRLLGSVRVSASTIEIGAPGWSQAPHMLLARDANLQLGYIDLWRAWQGAPLHVRNLEAAELDAALERQADGRASWQFGKKVAADASTQPSALPSFGQLRVGDGHLTYRDAILPSDIDARFALSDGSGDAGAAAAMPASSGTAESVAPADSGIVVRAGGAAHAASAVAQRVTLAADESGLRLKAVGLYRKLPVRVDLRTAG